MGEISFCYMKLNVSWLKHYILVCTIRCIWQGYYVQTRGLGQTWTICCWYHQTKNTQKGSSGNLTFRQGRTVCKYLTVKGSTLSLLVCLLSKSTFLGGQVEALQIFRDTFFMKLAQECVHVCVSSIPVTANMTLYATYFICET